ncbi:MAG TPA: tetratricopeptide repeat protein [Geminicoccaceae bacterium]
MPLLVATGLLAGCDSPEEREASHLARGIELAAQGEDAKALVEFKNVLQLDPKNTRAMYEVGLIHERAGRPYDAFAAYWKATLERPRFVAAQVKVGELSLAFEHIERASDAIHAVSEAAPDHPDGLALKGALALREGDVGAAMRHARAALERAPEHERAVAVLVGAHARRGETEQALARLEQALDAHPQSIELRVVKIALLEQAGDVAGIRATYDDIFELQPESVSLRLEAAELLLRNGWHGEVEGVLRGAIEDGLVDPRIAVALVDLVAERQGAVRAEAELVRLIDLMPDAYELRFKLVDSYIQAGRSADAEAVLDEIVAGTDNVDLVSEARVQLARIRLAAGDLESARRLVDEALAAVDDHPRAHLQRALMLQQEGDLDGAVLSARASLERDHAWLPGLRLLADLHLQRGEADAALTAYTNVVRHAPDDRATLERLATLLMQRGDDQPALKMWDRVLALDPGSVTALRARALIAIARRNWSEAEANIAWLDEIPGQDALVPSLEGWLLMSRGDFAAARTAFQSALAAGPDAARLTSGIVRSHLAEGDVDGALAFLEQRAREDPKDFGALALMGRLLARQGRLDQARQSFEQAISRAPDRIPLYESYSDVLYRSGDLPGSIEAVQAALARQPDDPNLLDRLAQMHLLRGATEAAIETYERLLEAGPPSDQAINNYAALIADFRPDDRQAIKRALALTEHFKSSDDPELLDTRAWLHFREGDLAAAEAFLIRATATASASPQIHYHLGMVLLEAEREEEAMVALERALRGEPDYMGVEKARAALERLRRKAEAGKPTES